MPRQIGPGRRLSTPAVLIAAGVALVVLLLGARTFASYAIEVAWWKELGQFHTWLSMLTYSVAPLAAATAVAFFALWIAHARALKFAGTRLAEHPLYARLATLGALALGYFIAASSIDTWTVIRFAGSRGWCRTATAWHDAVFAQPLSFYLFDLPFYDLLRGYVLALVILSILVYWGAARGWQLRRRFPDLVERPRDGRQLLPAGRRPGVAVPARRRRGAAAGHGGEVLPGPLPDGVQPARLVHGGRRLGGPEYRSPHAVAADCGRLAAALLVWLGRWINAAFMAIALVLAFAVPRLVSAVYVAPNEISLERPYIQTHIHATRSAYDLDTNVHEVEFHAAAGRAHRHRE
jgi:uncharacterized protein